jgi:hypothetical protein
MCSHTKWRGAIVSVGMIELYNMVVREFLEERKMSL